jgi:O-acetylserine/cysteine efflux transporter
MPSAPVPAFTGRDLAGAAAVVVIWGLNFVAIKVGLRDFTPFQLGAARFLFSLLPLALWVRPPPIGIGWLAAYGLLQGAGQFGFLFVALKVGMTAALSPLVMQMQVFVTALLGAVLLGERIGRPLKTGLLLAGAGLGCFAVGASMPKEAGAGAVTIAGLLLNLTAASMWAGSNIVVRRLQMRGVRYDALSLVVWGSAVSAAAFVAASALFDDPADRWNWTEASPLAWLSVAYIGWGANVLAYWLWTSLLTRHPASRVAPFSLGVPVVGVLAGMLLLGERVDASQWAGSALVMSALAFVLRAGPGSKG